MKAWKQLFAAMIVACGAMSSAQALEQVTYLNPAPLSLPTFAPLQIAKVRGYFKDENLDVKLLIGRGGADVAKQVAVGNADLGGAMGDTTMIVRANGLPLRAVALLGGHPLMKIASREDGPIKKITDLRGRKIAVNSFQDTGYYALLGALYGSGLKRDDVEVLAPGPAGVTKLMAAGTVDAIMATPDWGVYLEKDGMKLHYISVEDVFPSMAQAIIASDAVIKNRPQIVKGFVRAVMRALNDIVRDPEAAAKDFVVAVPEQKGREKVVEAIIRRMVRDVYSVPDPKQLGRFDPKVLKKVQDFYLEHKLIEKAVPVQDLYTNEFVEASSNQ